jgi:hypothetical protein
MAQSEILPLYIDALATKNDVTIRFLDPKFCSGSLLEFLYFRQALTLLKLFEVYLSSLKIGIGARLRVSESFVC